MEEFTRQNQRHSAALNRDHTISFFSGITQRVDSLGPKTKTKLLCKTTRLHTELIRHIQENNSAALLKTIQLLLGAHRENQKEEQSGGGVLE